MKKLFFTLILTLLVTIAASARTYVLVTGVSRYQDERNNLHQTTKDAKAFYEVIKTQSNDVTLLTSKNANRENILAKLKLLCGRAKQGDRVLFFFSGHGSPGAICTYDEFIYYKDIVSIFKACAASEKIMMVDACHAGSVMDVSGDYTMTSTDGIICFMSSRASEYSAESTVLGSGYFTQGLIKGLRGKADSDGNKQITVIELFKYIHADVVNHSDYKQHPQLIAPKSVYNTVVARW